MPSPNQIDPNVTGLDVGLATRSAPANTVSASAYTLTAADAFRIVQRSSGSAQTVTVPPDVFPVNTILTIEQNGAGALTLVAGAGVTLNKLSGKSLTLAGQYAVVQLRQTAQNVWTVFGALQ